MTPLLYAVSVIGVLVTSPRLNTILGVSIPTILDTASYKHSKTHHPPSKVCSQLQSHQATDYPTQFVRS